jgi:hypothetical protein
MSHSKNVVLSIRLWLPPFRELFVKYTLNCTFVDLTSLIRRVSKLNRQAAHNLQGINLTAHFGDQTTSLHQETPTPNISIYYRFVVLEVLPVR